MARIVNYDVQLTSDLVQHAKKIRLLRCIAAENPTPGNFDAGEIVEVQPEDFAARKVMRPQPQRRSVVTVRSALIAQRLIVPAAPVQAHETDFQQSDRTFTEMPKELGINTSVVMTPSARAFVCPVVIGQPGQWIGGWINPAGQLMG